MGNSIFASISKEAGRKKEAAFLDIHRKYIDIQMIISGKDEMGWSPIQYCTRPKTDYISESDIQFFTDGPLMVLPVTEKMFTIFFPEDAHKPSISSEMLHKIVIKVAL
ncbi:MAG: YhcH/YjgK/YiaL family protein [Candidatus Marinimicrobia bacterium]|nr:YhcH/YjgK/YiaL family protein [Candidatus Neomarinimicrobiota bacterium]